MRLIPDESGIWRLELAEGDELPSDAPVARQGGALEGLADMEVAGIPLGKAIVGGGVAALSTGLVGGLIPDDLVGGQGDIIGKGLLAWFLATQADRWLGKDAAEMAATFVVWDAVGGRVVEFVDNITGNLMGAIGGGTATQIAGGISGPGATIDDAVELGPTGITDSLADWADRVA